MSEQFAKGYNNGIANGRIEGWELAQKEITRLRAEVERRGEMLKYLARHAQSPFLPIRQPLGKKTQDGWVKMMLEIESLDNAPDSSSKNG